MVRLVLSPLVSAGCLLWYVREAVALWENEPWTKRLQPLYDARGDIPYA